jgi:hypothetical protein
MNDPENIVAAIYRAVDWINGESKACIACSRSRRQLLIASLNVRC